jgi:prepilin-type N-terminal cleavage/methylation domain-containing protein
MNRKISTKKAFTLLEILIATAIFSTVMVLTTGIISQSSGSQTKLKANREASEESRHLADLISRDIRTAEGSFRVKMSYLTTTTDDYYEFRNGIAFFNCATTGTYTCVPAYTDFVSTDQGPANLNNDPSEYHANAMLVYSNGILKAYFSTGSAVYLRIFDTNVSPLPVPLISFWYPTTKYLTLHSSASNSIFKFTVEDSYKLSSSSLDSAVNFAGFASSNNLTRSGSTFSIATQGTDLQSYVSYYITVKTDNFDTLPVRERAETFIRSTITPRNYAM